MCTFGQRVPVFFSQDCVNGKYAAENNNNAGTENPMVIVRMMGLKCLICLINGKKRDEGRVMVVCFGVARPWVTPAKEAYFHGSCYFLDIQPWRPSEMGNLT